MRLSLWEAISAPDDRLGMGYAHLGKPTGQGSLQMGNNLYPYSEPDPADDLSMDDEEEPWSSLWDTIEDSERFAQKVGQNISVGGGSPPQRNGRNSKAWVSGNTRNEATSLGGPNRIPPVGSGQPGMMAAGGLTTQAGHTVDSANGWTRGTIKSKDDAEDDDACSGEHEEIFDLSDLVER